MQTTSAGTPHSHSSSLAEPLQGRVDESTSTETQALNGMPHERANTNAALSRVADRNEESILLVDDDVVLLEATAQSLRYMGFRVYSFNNPKTALELANSSTPIGLLLTDLQMPQMDGIELARLCVTARPNLRVLVQSGALLDDRQLQIVQAHGWRFMSKPVSICELAAMVSLHTKPATGASRSDVATGRQRA